MEVVCPFDQKLLSHKAHDKVIVKTCGALAEAGVPVTVLFQEGPDTEEVVRFYGLSGASRLLRFVSQRLRFSVIGFRVSFRYVYRRSCLTMARHLGKDGRAVVYLSELPMANHFVRFRRASDPMVLVYEVHDLERLKGDRANHRRVELEDRVFRSVDGLIVTTEALASRLVRDYVIPRKCLVRVIHLCSTYPGEVEPAERMDRDGMNVFYLGQIYPLQGLEVAIEALALAPQWRLHIVGYGTSQYVGILAERARRAGVGGRVVWHGFRKPDDLPKLIVEADAFVLPASDQERMPYVAHTKLYDYLACAKPILAADLPSVREVVDDGGNGFLFPPGDHVALAGLLVRLAKDPALMSRLGRGALDTAGRYSCDERARSMSAMFREMWGGR